MDSWAENELDSDSSVIVQKREIEKGVIKQLTNGCFVSERFVFDFELQFLPRLKP